MFFWLLSQEGTIWSICTCTFSVFPKRFAGVHCTVPSFQRDGLLGAKETALQTLVSSCLEFKRLELIRPLQGMICSFLFVSFCFHAAFNRWQPIPLRHLRLVTPSAEIQSKHVKECAWDIWSLHPAHRTTYTNLKACKFTLLRYDMHL